MPDMQQQIDALREVFSADMRKPFVLKPTFPYGSQGALVNTTPPRPNVEGMDTKSDSPTVQPLGMTPTGQRSLQPRVGSLPLPPPLYTVLTFTQVNGTGLLARTLPRPPPLFFKPRTYH
jgi:hypothetical protein